MTLIYINLSKKIIFIGRPAHRAACQYIIYSGDTLQVPLPCHASQYRCRNLELQPPKLSKFCHYISALRGKEFARFLRNSQRLCLSIGRLCFNLVAFDGQTTQLLKAVSQLSHYPCNKHIFACWIGRGSRGPSLRSHQCNKTIW